MHEAKLVMLFLSSQAAEGVFGEAGSREVVRTFAPRKFDVKDVLELALSVRTQPSSFHVSKQGLVPPKEAML